MFQGSEVEQSEAGKLGLEKALRKCNVAIYAGFEREQRP